MKLNDILNKAAAGSLLYYRKWDYLRSVALTQAMKELEEEGANIIGGKISRIVNRSVGVDQWDRPLENREELMNATETLAFTNYSRFILNGVEYYIQYEDNYFFDDHITLHMGDKSTYWDDNKFNVMSNITRKETNEEAIEMMKCAFICAVASANARYTYKEKRDNWKTNSIYTVYVNGGKSFDIREGDQV